MGRDKGTIVDKNSKLVWVQKAALLFSELNIPCYISLRRDQENLYSNYFSKEQFIFDEDTGIKGPMNGIISAFKRYQKSDFFVIAVDMVYLDSLVIKTILESYSLQKNRKIAFAYINSEKKVEPLCSIYTSNVSRLLDLSLKSLKDFFKVYSAEVELIKSDIAVAGKLESLNTL